MGVGGLEMAGPGLRRMAGVSEEERLFARRKGVRQPGEPSWRSGNDNWWRRAGEGLPEDLVSSLLRL